LADPAGILDLPEGFRYWVISRTGERMRDGLLVPGAHDSMAAFADPAGRTILVPEKIVDEWTDEISRSVVIAGRAA
jgi:secreted PhoX family phosphatase